MCVYICYIFFILLSHSADLFRKNYKYDLFLYFIQNLQKYFIKIRNECRIEKFESMKNQDNVSALVDIMPKMHTR